MTALELIALLVALAVFVPCAWMWGADSRDGFSDLPPTYLR